MANKNNNSELKRNRFSAWLIEHKTTAIESIVQLWRSPLTMIFTCSVISLSLVIPVIFTVVNQSISNVVSELDTGEDISLYINKATTDRAIASFKTELLNNPQIIDVKFVTPEQGIAELEDWAGIGEALKLLDENPLPPVITIKPRPNMGLPALEKLVQDLETSPLVSFARLDFEWISRVYTFSEFFQKLVTILWVLLSLGAVLVIGNSIRMIIEARREEIIIVKMVGGTNKYASRPFIYTGFWIGLISGLIAWVIVQISLIVLSNATVKIVSLYNSNYQVITGIGFQGLFLLIFIASFLGYLGALIAVKFNIAKIEPK